MIILTDTEQELDEQIELHKLNGWRVVKRIRRNDGSYTATLTLEKDPKETKRK